MQSSSPELWNNSAYHAMLKIVQDKVFIQADSIL